MAQEPGYRDRSVLIHGKFRSEKWDFQDHITPPITTAVTFRLRSAERGAAGFQQFANPNINRDTATPIYIYERLDEPCSGMLEENLAFAERGETAVVFATGMAAIAAAIGIHVRQGDHIVMPPAIYGCTYSHVVNWLPRFGITHTLANFQSEDALRAAIRPETRVVYFETPTNPTMELIDLEMLDRVVAEVNATRPADQRVVSIVDNTFASPFGQRPLTHGIDFVVHSLTKHIGGFGTNMGGVVIGPRRAETDLLLYRKDFGGSIAPDTAWHVSVYGLPTLPHRLEVQQRNAALVADYLAEHPAVAQVWYPGRADFPQRALAERQMRDYDGNFAPGSMLFFSLRGSLQESYEAAMRVSNHIAAHALSVTLAVSLGQIKTLIEHPASMTHSAIAPEVQMQGGILPGGLRLSIGLEDPRDIIADLERALALA